MALCEEIKVEKQLEKRGWILGPNESNEAYLSRIKMLEHFYENPPETVDHFLTDRDWEPALDRMENLYGCRPDWIVAHYSDQNLPFFQGGATWIVEKKGVRIPLIQLKEKFERGSLLGLYKREEVLAHEIVHAVRMPFDEPRFEEIFAYRTSQSWWRRAFGPLFEKSWESVFFLLLLFLPIAVELLPIFGIEWGLWAYLRFLPGVFFGWLLFRLGIYQLSLHRALKKMGPNLLRPEEKWATALHLTDGEIFRFAFQSNERLKEGFLGEKSPRWTFLRQNFFKKISDWV